MLSKNNLIQQTKFIDSQYQDILKSYNSFDTQMRYFKQYSQNIVEKASDYNLAIDRFYVPLSSVPIFIFNNTQVTDINKVTTYSYYSVELSYNGIYSGQTFIQYIPRSGSSVSADKFYYYVYGFGNFLEMINTTLSSAFTKLSGLVTLPTDSIAPHFEIDYTNYMLSFVGQSNFYDSSLASPITVYMNNPMQQFMSGIPSSYNGSFSNGRNIIFKFSNLYNNIITWSSSDYYKMNSEYGTQTLIRWNIAKGLVFTTDTIPVNTENLPATLNQSLLISRGILANFDFIYTSDAPKPFSAQYILQSPYKQITLINDTPINVLDITVYWYDMDNNLYDTFIYSGEALSMRLVFLRKK